MLSFMEPNLPPLAHLAKRLHPHTRGALAEKLAHIVYALQGYRPLPRKHRALAQTDLLLTKGQSLLVAEVKYRTTRGRGHLALTPAQRTRLTRQLRALAGHYPNHTIVFEVLLVFPHWPFLQRVRQLDLA
jgi:Holliday junction resolvase-like predicted endonuclease